MLSEIDNFSALRTRIVRIVRESTGLHEQIALPVADAIYLELQQHFGGSSVYVPVPSRAARNRAILADWESGLSPDAIRRRHHVSRATVYRLLRPTLGGGGGAEANFPVK
jgi:Mor family transcriptional regulator